MSKQLFGMKISNYTPIELMELLVRYMAREDLTEEQIELVNEANGHMARCDFKKASLTVAVIQYSDMKENKEEFEFISKYIKEMKDNETSGIR